MSLLLARRCSALTSSIVNLRTWAATYATTTEEKLRNDANTLDAVLNAVPPQPGFPSTAQPPGTNPFTKNAQIGAAGKSAAQTVLQVQYHLYARCTNSNAMFRISDQNNMPIKRGFITSGTMGMRNAARGTYEAGYQCVTQVFERLREAQREEFEKHGKVLKVHIHYKWGGRGKQALHDALLANDGQDVMKMINQLTDCTPIKIGGTKAKKARRL